MQKMFHLIIKDNKIKVLTINQAYIFNNKLLDNSKI